MKHILFLALILLVGLTACRKKIEREIDLINEAGPIDCEDNLFNGDELGTDCGGIDCEDCPENPAPCTNENNKIYMVTDVTPQTISVTSSAITESGENWVFTAFTGGGTINFLRFTFLGKPNIVTTYSGINSTATIADNEVDVVYSHVSSGEKIGNGDVYVNYANGTYNLSSCDYSFHESGQSTPTVTQWFNVSIN